ncbi:hypothetical protein [Streptomyces liliifuscus]|uniref:Uncharacterized protein n=1 Tax=Streptomyces liliifuscus TaxID=2797636 RepID=A0A7T7RH27_9ACTN|nr:hypothetical protein [Streptomyces liliifuscus]QQM46364.1 hypothetical protein JEQ17_47865 [Streptomyces liliifuscus]
MSKRVATVLGAAAAAFMLAVTPASARVIGPGDTVYDDSPGHFYYERSCETYYSLSISRTRAVASKDKFSGHCSGHAWLRVMGDSLGEWRHGETGVRLTSPSGKFRWGYVKGCEDCYAYIVYAGPEW